MCVWCVASVHSIIEVITHEARSPRRVATPALENGGNTYVDRQKNHKFLRAYEEALVEGETKLHKATIAAQKGLQAALNVQHPAEMLQASIQSLMTAQGVAAGVEAGRSHCEWCANRV